MTLPRKIRTPKTRQSDRIRCPGHLKWVRQHSCCVRGCYDFPIEVAHVRSTLDGGIALKPGDQWTISLCHEHHRVQHQIGEQRFEDAFGIDMKKLAAEFAAKSDPLRRYLARKRAT